MDAWGVVYVLVGGAITWLAAWLYYKKAGDELKKETAELSRLTSLILRSLEEAGLAKLNRNGSGKIIGLAICGSPSFSTSAGLVAKVEVVHGKSGDQKLAEKNQDSS